MNPLPPFIGEHDQVVLFDGVCKLCSAWSRFVIKHDHQRRFKLASVQSPEGQALLRHFGYPTDYYETMILVVGNQAYQKSESFFRIMGELGFPWKLMLMFRPLPLGLRDWLYDRIALNRYRIFGKTEYCMMPAPEHLDRFLHADQQPKHD